LIEIGLSLIAQLKTAYRTRAELEQPQTKRVASRFSVPPDQPVLVEYGEEAMDCALVEG
jgi:hypothetical protein